MNVKISRETIEEIRARTDLPALIGSRVSLKQSGGLLKGLCPFHQEKTPSFVVYADDRSFHCFGCNAHGNAFDFLMRSEGLTFVDAVRQLARQAGIQLEHENDARAGLRHRLYAMHEALAAFYRRCLLQTAVAAKARQYLLSRNLTEADAERFLIGYAPRKPGTLTTWANRHDFTEDLLEKAGLLAVSSRSSGEEGDRGKYYDRFKGRLMFPIRDHLGRVIGFSGRLLEKGGKAAKYVNSPETLIFQKGRILYGMDLARADIVNRPGREVLVCEGQIDVIRCHAAGFANTVAAQGTAFTHEHATLLKRYADSAVLVFDGDAAGHKAALRTACAIMAAGMPVRIAQLPDGEDPDSFLRQSGPDKFRQLVEQAESVVPFQVKYLQRQEQRPEAVDAVERIAGQVMATIAQAASPIQRARLLQEAAGELNLPEKALSEALDQLSARKRPRPPVPSPAAAPEKAADRITAGHTLPVNRDHGNHNGQPTPEETTLCELVCHHEDDAAVVLAIEDYLPLVFVEHAPCRQIIAAAIESRDTGRDVLRQLQSGSEKEAIKWINRFAASDHRVATARDATPEQAAHDCIMGIWRKQLLRERRQLDAGDGVAEEILSRRWSLTKLIGRLSAGRWQQAQPLLAEEIQRRRQELPADPTQDETG